MAKSAAARRRQRLLRAGGGVMMAAPVRVNDWIIGGSSVDNTGGTIGGGAPTGPSTWTDNYAITLGVLQAYQAVVIAPAPATSTPGIGKLRINRVRGNLLFTTMANGGSAQSRLSIGVCIYVAQVNSTTTKWDMRDPLSSADAARDDYLFLEKKTFDYPVLSQVTTETNIDFELNISQPVIIGGGQALHVAFNTDSTVAGTMRVHSAFRTQVGPVA